MPKAGMKPKKQAIRGAIAKKPIAKKPAANKAGKKQKNVWLNLKVGPGDGRLGVDHFLAIAGVKAMGSRKAKVILLHKAVKTNKFKTQDLKNLGEELGMPRETWDVPAMYTKYYYKSKEWGSFETSC